MKVTAAQRGNVKNLVEFYMKKPHPFTACVRDNTKRFGKDRAERICAKLKDIGTGTTKWRGKDHKAAIADDLIAAADGNVDGLIEAMIEGIVAEVDEDVSAINWLQANQPQLVTVKDVEILKTGIEYPLASGPKTFTEDDLRSILQSQDDPGIGTPRVWLGHPDDPRLHGHRHPGGPPSGEPAVGRVINMVAAEEGHSIRADLVGVPLWIAKIISTAYPSRSIEASVNVKTVTGKTWPVVMSGLALLGVCWPGVTTLEDIAVLFTDEGPEDVQVIEATSEEPVTVLAANERVVEGQITVEDLRRQFYENLGPDNGTWWIRGIYLDPNEVIVDDDKGDLWRIPYGIKNDTVTFGEAKKVKVKYVNAANGITTEPLTTARVLVAQFGAKEEQQEEPKRELVIDIAASQPGRTIEIPIIARTFSTKQRKAASGKGQAMPDGSFPIVTVEDLKNAIRAIGRAKNPAAAKAHIKKRARALGQTKLIPEGW